uniref:DUF6922 domain-containing protein n=1 Tax=Candidatus Cryptobacteroides bacterium TaxID=3085639 RepID=UPI004028B7F1
MDLDTNESYVIKRVLEFCQMNDWYQLVSRYGLERIVRVSQRLRTLPILPRTSPHWRSRLPSSEEVIILVNFSVIE